MGRIRKGYHRERRVVGYSPEGTKIWGEVIVPNSPNVEVPSNFPEKDTRDYQLTLTQVIIQEDKDKKSGKGVEQE